MEAGLTGLGGEGPHYSPATITRIAQRVLASLENIKVAEHRWEPADPRDFRHLDRKWYERMQRELEACGFRHLGDLRLVGQPTQLRAVRPSFARKSVSAGGETRADLFEVRMRWWPRLLILLTRLRIRRPSRVLSLRSEFDDGVFVVTTTARRTFSSSPGVLPEWLPPATPVADVVRLHRQRIVRYLEQHGGVPCVRTAQLDEALASEARAQGRRAADRRRIGTVSVDELCNMGYSPQLAVLVAAEMERLHAQPAP